MKYKKNYKGCYAKYHYKSVRSFVDYDYVDQLSETDKEWLSNFSDNFYGARFNPKTSVINDTETRREIYRDNNKRKKCAMSARTQSVDFDPNILNTLSSIEAPDINNLKENQLDDQVKIKPSRKEKYVWNKILKTIK